VQQAPRGGKPVCERFGYHVTLPCWMSSPTVPATSSQVRRAQADGILDPAGHPVDILALVSQIATTWPTQTELRPLAAREARTPTTAARRAATAARRAAVVEAVQRLFPTQAATSPTPCWVTGCGRPGPAD
jgi:hypothetical protein